MWGRGTGCEPDTTAEGSTLALWPEHPQGAATSNGMEAKAVEGSEGRKGLLRL